ncbi:cation:proton antiporter [Halorussus salinus]|uniref:cation:proton antiporter n=1 Tax=Halorussus salinus TaxID=1364935 RepID=UPI001092E232|nr:cation:proton antiporter [Halorussus salinus]
MSELVVLVAELMLVLGIAAVVRTLARRVRIPFTVVLVVVGFAISVSQLQVSLDLSSDLVMKVLLPTIIFQGAEETKRGHFADTLPEAILMVVLGLPFAVLLLGLLGSYAFGVPIVIALLFAVIVYPIDPVAVLAIFRDTEAPARLGVLAETESHLSEGFAIVTFSTLLALVWEQVQTDQPIEGLVTLPELFDLAVQITWVSLGGLVVGAVTGGLVLLVLRYTVEEMAQLLFLVILPYGSYLLAEEVLHLSGVLAVVSAGLLIGTYGKAKVIRPESVEFIEEIWRTAAFLATTVLFVLVGIRVPVDHLLNFTPLILVATLLVFLVRAVSVYPVIKLVNRTSTGKIPLDYQHVLVWGGMHTVIPIALFLSVPDALPYHDKLGAMVFGVAVLSIVVQGVLMPYVLRTTETMGSMEGAIDAD